MTDAEMPEQLPCGGFNLVRFLRSSKEIWVLLLCILARCLSDSKGWLLLF
jgi:hypothetical protein